MIVYIGLDDTDTLESRGTGRLAREIAGELGKQALLLGVTRHQLLVDPRIPYTSHNSSAAITLEIPNSLDPTSLFEQVRKMVMDDFQTGSDPGLCLTDESIARQITEFGKRTQRELIFQSEARSLADTHHIRLEGLGGSEDGIIGALAAVGLAAGGNDGRYILFGRSREISGAFPIADLLSLGIAEIRNESGQNLHDGIIEVEKLRPSRRGHRPVLFVEFDSGVWRPLKLDY